jgi:hypothetical protein
MTYSIDLNEYGVRYVERDQYTVYVHLIEEEDGRYFFFATVAPDMFTAIASASMHGRVIHTEGLRTALETLKEAVGQSS